MKKNILYALLLLPGFAMGQARQELKIDLFHAFTRSAFATYEIAPKKHFGMEFGLGYKWDKIGFFKGNQEDDIYQGFDRGIGQLYLGAKYYTSKKSNADRWFVGGYFLEEYELSRDPAYDDVYLETFGTPSKTSKNARTALGAMAGYKKVFKNRFVLELGMEMDLNIAGLFDAGNQSVVDLGGRYNVKVGYRISDPKKADETKKEAN